MKNYLPLLFRILNGTTKENQFSYPEETVSMNSETAKENSDRRRNPEEVISNDYKR